MELTNDIDQNKGRIWMALVNTLEAVRKIDEQQRRAAWAALVARSRP
jgi:hypothetical protein